jgi:TetR/AcrR family transcriptional regulator, transcriptional repressor for nem operon
MRTTTAPSVRSAPVRPVAIRDACATSVLEHAATLESDLDAALTEPARAAGLSARSLAIHIQVVLQGSFVLAKAADDPSLVAQSLDHLTRYLTDVLRAPHCATTSSLRD